MYIVISKFKVANDMSCDVQQAFKNRPHLVDQVEGFIAMEVLQPEHQPDEFWLLTRWSDQEKYQQWHRGHSYKKSHQGIPKGLKLIPGETEIRHFELLSE
ncbi:MAG: antibiotic biosynthesis monooxygenase [Gammaproteobacteria bacterium]|nr:antibiotic biosynthesis monooxygenase [Gammaproteobacteria bacterium]